MEVYKDISSSQNQEFKKLLIDNFSKTKIEEGNLLVGIITKISEKHIYLLIDGMKSEALIDINEAKSVFANKQLKENDKLEVYLEKIENSKGEVIATSAYLAAWDINKCPSDPITPKLIAKINWIPFGVIKLSGKNIIDVINNAKE